MMAQNADPIHNFVSRITQIRHVVSRITPIHQLNKTNKILQENYITKTLHCIFLVLFYFWNCVGTPPPSFLALFHKYKNTKSYMQNTELYACERIYVWGALWIQKLYYVDTMDSRKWWYHFAVDCRIYHVFRIELPCPFWNDKWPRCRAL